MAEVMEFDQDAAFAELLASRSGQEVEENSDAPKGVQEEPVAVRDDQEQGDQEQPGAVADAKRDAPQFPDSSSHAAEEEFVPAQKFKVASGRLQAVSRENAELKARLAEIEAAGNQPAPQMQEQEVPDELREDLSVIAAIDPELAGMVREQSADGDKLRKALVKIGPESTLALAESMRTRRMVEQREAGNAVRQRANAAHAHYESVLAAVPDLANVSLSGVDADGQVRLLPLEGKESEFKALFDGLHSWLDELPHGQARGFLDTLYKTGSPSDIAGVFKKYGESKKPVEFVDQKHAAELASVPSRGARPVVDAPAATMADLFEQALRDRKRGK